MRVQAARQRDAYFDFLKNERRLSPHTLSNYRRDLDTLAAFCDARGLDDWRALTVQQARARAAPPHEGGRRGPPPPPRPRAVRAAVLLRAAPRRACVH